jgi:hypothetical protein
MKSCSFGPGESDVAAHFYKGTVGRLITANGPDQSVDGEIGQVVAATVVKQGAIRAQELRVRERGAQELGVRERVVQ